MQRRLLFLLQYYSLWLIYFLLAKILFLFYHLTKTSELDSLTILGIFWHGIKLDLSFSAYFSVIPFLLFPVFNTLKIDKFNLIFLKIYTAACLVFSGFIIIADLELYKNWGFRIDATPLMYINHPREMAASAGASPLFLLVSLLLFLLISSFLVFNRFINHLKAFDSYHKWYFFPIGIFLASVLIIPIRGGFQLSPVNQSTVYFSNIPFANHAAINPLWNFFDSVVNKTAESENPFIHFSKKEAKSVVDSLFSEKSTTTLQVLNTDRPNVLIITWESLTAKAFSKTGGLSNILPELTQLSDEGILFKQCFASGDRSDKGLIAVLSGYPAQPITSIMTMPKKTAKLPVLSKDFRKAGYSTAWYYGGEPEFANIKSYMLNGQFEKLVTKNDFNQEDMQNTRWGADDHVVFNRLLHDLGTYQKPFFVNYFTLSSHEPFIVPMKTVIKGDDEKSMFLNALHYTDKSLGDFIRKAKEQNWWKNTLVVIIADHGHPLPENPLKPNNFHIPMLWLGGALKEKGIVIDKIVSQNDLARTLLNQVHLDSREYIWSKDIFSKDTHEFAYFAFHNGFGLIQPGKWFVFDNVSKQIIQQEGEPSKQDISAGKALVQSTFQDFLDK